MMCTTDMEKAFDPRLSICLNTLKKPGYLEKPGFLGKFFYLLIFFYMIVGEVTDSTATEI